MPTRQDVAANMRVRQASLVIAAPATTAFDFGTPDDIDLRTTTFKPGDRVLVVLSATRAAGTTSTLTYTIQDAPDSSGSIGTPATAVVTGTIPAHAAGDAGQKGGIVAVTVQPGRPWIRVNLVHALGTDSFQAHVSVIGISATP